MKCDLHIHTNCSDGAFSPEDVVALAKNAGLTHIAVTDHDTTSGVARAVLAGLAAGIQVLPAIEISTVQDNQEVHILGYNLNIADQNFHNELQQIADLRNIRNQKLVEKLAENGFEVDLAAIQSQAQGSVGRPDIARALVAKGYCVDMTDAFERLIGKGKPCYVQTQRLTPCQAVAFVRKFDGISVLAHPRTLHMNGARLTQFLKCLASCGLTGIEAEYFTHTKSERKYYSRLAKKMGLIITGGSDFHDFAHGAEIGKRHLNPNGYTKRILNIK